MATVKELSECNDIDNLFEFVSELKVRIGNLGGIKFYFLHSKDSVNSRQIVAALGKIYDSCPKERELLQTTTLTINKIKKLNGDAKTKLLQQAWWVRFLTWVKTFFENLFIYPKYKLEQLELIVQKEQQQLHQRFSSSQHSTQDNLSSQQTETSNKPKKTEPHSSYLYPRSNKEPSVPIVNPEKQPEQTTALSEPKQEGVQGTPVASKQGPNSSYLFPRKKPVSPSSTVGLGKKPSEKRTKQFEKQKKAEKSPELAKLLRCPKDAIAQDLKKLMALSEKNASQKEEYELLIEALVIKGRAALDVGLTKGETPQEIFKDLGNDPLIFKILIENGLFGDTLDNDFSYKLYHFLDQLIWPNEEMKQQVLSKLNPIMYLSEGIRKNILPMLIATPIPNENNSSLDPSIEEIPGLTKEQQERRKKALSKAYARAVTFESLQAKLAQNPGNFQEAFGEWFYSQDKNTQERIRANLEKGPLSKPGAVHFEVSSSKN